MKEMKTTPGPWKAKGEFVMTCNNNNRVATAYDGSESPVRDEEAVVANARLMAAAPEMLEVLKQVEGMVAAWAYDYFFSYLQKGSNVTTKNWHPIHREVYKNVRTAIAKATGERE